jgi:hypothetical protein
MNIKGRARGSPGNLANHLQKDENERVWIIGTQGIVAQDIDGALMEMDALGAGLKTSKTLYHMQINPAPTDPAMTPQQIDYAVTTALQKLDLDNQPHIVIGHLKTGASGIQREHYHVVASRTDLEHNRAISDSHNFRKHEEAAREIERALGHERVQGAHIERFGIERPERTLSAAEIRQAERGAVSAKEAKALGAEIWASTDSGKAISAALAEHGWNLTRGDKERKDGGAYFMAIDPQGHAHELRRMVPVKAAALYERMADIDPAMLPSVSEAKQQQDFRRDLAVWAREEAARGAEQEKHRAADPSRDPAAERAPEAAQTWEASATSSAPGQENTHTTEPQRAAEEIFFREARPAAEAPRVIYLGASADMPRHDRGESREQADELGRAAVPLPPEKTTGIFGRMMDAFAERLGAVIMFFADFISPPSPPTTEQVKQMERAAEEQKQQEPAAREHAEAQARLRDVLEQAKQRRDEQSRDDRDTGERLDRGDEAARYDRWTGYPIDRDDDYDQGRERERDRDYDFER